MYALNLSDDGRILSATYPQFAPENATVVEELPEGNIYEYRYINGEFVHEPLPVEENIEDPTEADDTAAMLVDHEYRLTLLELGIVE